MTSPEEAAAVIAGMAQRGEFPAGAVDRVGAVYDTIGDAIVAMFGAGLPVDIAPVEWVDLTDHERSVVINATGRFFGSVIRDIALARKHRGERGG